MFSFLAMHMSDALISPFVGGILWLVSIACIAYSAKKVREEGNEKKIPLMGVLGAFVFAAQMINFTIPMTGSSGHLGGGILLAILLGPWSAFIAMAAILGIQALLFADGGLLAYGCNLFNIGFIPCFIAYPFLYKWITGNEMHISSRRIMWGSFVAAIVGLQLGAFAVVLETWFSGISELPFARFTQLMQPIHLAIGIVEGLATSAIVLFLVKAQPSLLGKTSLAPIPAQPKSGSTVLAVMAVLALATGGVLSWFASENPDGLEWAISRTSAQEELASPEKGVHQSLAQLQNKTALLPDYSLPASENRQENTSLAATSFSGVTGAIAVLFIMLALGWILRKKSNPSNPSAA